MKNTLFKVTVITVIVIVGIVITRIAIIGKVNGNANITAITIDAKKAVNEVVMSEIFSAVEYIPLETDDGHLIGNISQMLVFKDRIYVADIYQTQSVFCYSKEGKFIYEINRQGYGPGEYIALNSISIDHDKERLLLYADNTVFEYDLDGNYVESHKIRISVNDFSYVDKNRTIFYGDYTGSAKYEKNGMTPNLYIAENYSIVSTDVYFPSTTNYGALTSPFMYISNGNHGTVSLIYAYNDTIYHIAADTVERAYHVDFGDMKKDENFYQSIFSSEATRTSVQEYVMSRDVCNILTFAETDACLFFAYHHRNVYHHVFYYKNTNRVIDACRTYSDETEPTFPITDDIAGLRFAIPFATDGQSFYSYIDAYEIAAMKASIIDPDLKKKFESLSEDDNPVIIKMTPKIK
jgi:hypothetical protein